ncbi:branched-chain amino acid ABC transporter substrate-binding protein [Nitratireductor sp. CH_MIT9313-5]|uniref:branched-chain amino acid ABC transporter substrate-binding protein n=1 Tax=Nitratireductor sp. CH_MIT9313-5 TaxID=3107764 RepID=UPI0030097427
MRIAALIFSLTLLCLPAVAQELRLGIAAPLSGSFQMLGEQWADGARVAAQNGGTTVTFEIFDTRCDEDEAPALAARMVEAEVDAVAGFLCTPVAMAALPLLAEAGIPVVTPIRSTGLTDQRQRSGFEVYRIGPRADEERAALADILTERWREAFFAIVDDGTIYGRELAETFRASAEEAELEPVYVDTYRPQLENQIGLVGRLRRAGASHVMVGGDRTDIAIIARDAAELGMSLTIAGGEALRAESGGVPLAEGVLMVAPPLWEDLASEQALAALDEETVEPAGYVLPGYAAAEILISAHRRAQDEGGNIAEVLKRHSFNTAIGIVSFDEKGDRKQQLYRLYRYDGLAFQEIE